MVAINKDYHSPKPFPFSEKIPEGLQENCLFARWKSLFSTLMNYSKLMKQIFKNKYTVMHLNLSEQIL
jgi:hypothetical protein